MSATHPELENSIQLALEAATAANDAAEDSTKTTAETRAAADRLDNFARTMRPLMIGLIGGAALCLLLGGLVYVRTLSDMRAAHATQMEALTLFTNAVGDLKGRVDALEGVEELDARLAALASGETDGFTALGARISALSDALAEKPAARDAGGETGGAGPSPQMLRSLSESMTENHQVTRERFAAGLSDLQLALTRMLADAPVATETAPKPEKPVAAKPRPAPKRAPARPRPEPNPYSFP